MIVLDASAVVELLLNTATGQAVAKRMADPAIGVHVPHLVDVEVVQALSSATVKRSLNCPLRTQPVISAHEPE